MGPMERVEKQAEILKSKLELVALLASFRETLDPNSSPSSEAVHAHAIAARDAKEAMKRFIAEAQHVGNGFGAGA
jgi:hypothetical protein